MRKWVRVLEGVLWIFWRNAQSLSLPQAAKNIKIKNSIISILLSEGTWKLSAQATVFGSLERILDSPSGFLVGRWEINTPKAEPQDTEHLVKIQSFYQWNWLHYWISPLYNIIRPFISNLPFPVSLREDKRAATDLSSLYLLLTMRQHLEVPRQPTRVYLPDATDALRGSTLVHFKKWLLFILS